MAARTLSDVLPPRYTSVVVIARGGMGEVYSARDEALGRPVAVKLLAEHHARDPALRERFTREALAAARLSGDPHTVTIFDVGEWDGRPYIVMQLVGGGTIAEHLDGRGHDPGESLRWLEQAAAALDAAHAHGVVHRDVKPANLLLTPDGDVRVADFGIASATGLSSLTETGSVLGTMGYLAPEQALGGKVGPEADRYALAVVAYELLAGRRPFQHATGPAEALAARQQPVPPISSEAPGLPPALDLVFERALAVDPAARYGSAAELVAALRHAFDAPAETTHVRPTRAATLPPTHAAPRRTHRIAWALALLALAGAGVAAALLLTRGGGDKPRAGQQPAVVRTVTTQGATVTVTTAPATTTSPAATRPPPPPPPSGQSGSALNNTGYSRMRAGDYRGALPLLEQAVRRLQGTGSLTEAYALYNLAYTRFALGRCGGVLAMLDRSQAIQGHRSEIDALRGRAHAGCG